MIALALLLQTAPVSTPPVLPAPIGRQALPNRGCAAYLWTRGATPELVALVVAEPQTLRLALGGKPADLARTGASGGNAGLGFVRRADYQLPDGVATVDLTLAMRPDLTDGAAVTNAALTITRGDADTVVIPLGGLVGCAAATR